MTWKNNCTTITLMKKSLLKVYKFVKEFAAAVNHNSSIEPQHPVLKGRKLMFSQIKKSHNVYIGDQFATVYTVPVVGCDKPSKHSKEIKAAVRKFFFDKDLKDWSYYGIEKEEVKVCKFIQ